MDYKHNGEGVSRVAERQSYQAPLAHLVPGNVVDHSSDAMRKSITTRWNEPT